MDLVTTVLDTFTRCDDITLVGHVTLLLLFTCLVREQSAEDEKTWRSKWKVNGSVVTCEFMDFTTAIPFLDVVGVVSKVIPPWSFRMKLR